MSRCQSLQPFAAARSCRQKSAACQPLAIITFQVNLSLVTLGWIIEAAHLRTRVRVFSLAVATAVAF